MKTLQLSGGYFISKSLGNHGDVEMRELDIQRI